MIGSITLAAADAPPAEGLVVWLDAADGGTLLQDDKGQLVAWQSKAKTSQSFVRDPGSEAAVIKSAIDGKPAVRFSGKDSLTSESPFREAKGPATIFVVFQRTEAQKSQQKWQRLASVRRDAQSKDTESPNFHLLTESNGEAVTRKPVIAHSEHGNVGIGRVTIGASGGGGNWLHGDIGEVLIYDRAFLSEGEQRIVLDYLHEKWKAKINEVGWTRVGPLGETPKHTRQDVPLSDQANKGNWTLDTEFSDEFNAPSLDLKRWHLNGPFPGDWFGREPAMFLPKNVEQKDGTLQLTFRKEDVPEMKQWKQYAGYTSALIRSNARTGYGYYETRAKPMPSAASSSFWFTDTGLKDNGTEIDVFEIGAKGKGFERKYNMNSHVWKTPESDRHWSVGGVWDTPWNLGDNYHVYGFEWNKDELIWYVDGVVVRKHKNTNWFFPMQVMYDTEAMWQWFGKVDDADLPSTFHIDYLRVWRRR